MEVKAGPIHGRQAADVLGCTIKAPRTWQVYHHGRK